LIKNMNNKLLKAKSIFEIEKYKKKAMPEVMAYLKEFRKVKNRGEYQTVYNSELEEYINEREKISDNLQHYLGTEVYLAQGEYRENIKQAKKEKLLSEGWSVLSEDVEYRGKIELLASVDSMLGNGNILQTCTIITDGDGKPFIIAKGKRSRGWRISSLNEAFYKLITG